MAGRSGACRTGDDSTLSARALGVSSRMAVLFERSASTAGMVSAVERAAQFPRLRFMGSKYKVVPALVDLVSRFDCDSILDAFSGSGVVGYAFKALGKQVTTNDFLAFTATVARATVENGTVRLSDEDVSVICSGNQDGRDFISRTFHGLYFPPADLAFLDAAWSQVDSMPSRKRDLALAALCLAAARKQPRGVFTVTDLRYDDGRRQLRAPLKELFVEAAGEYTATVFDNGRESRSLCQDEFELDPEGYDAVYLDPNQPYQISPSSANRWCRKYTRSRHSSTYTGANSSEPLRTISRKLSNDTNRISATSEGSTFTRSSSTSARVR